MKSQQNISKAQNTFINLTGNEDTTVQGGWVSVSLHEWIVYLEQKVCVNHSLMTDEWLRHEFLNFIIQALDNCSYGAGCNYELYEERKQDDIQFFLSTLLLTPEESRYVKQESGYIDDFSPYVMICSKCGNEDAAIASAKSLQREGIELCTQCFNVFCE